MLFLRLFKRNPTPSAETSTRIGSEAYWKQHVEPLLKEATVVLPKEISYYVVQLLRIARETQDSLESCVTVVKLLVEEQSKPFEATEFKEERPTEAYLNCVVLDLQQERFDSNISPILWRTLAYISMHHRHDAIEDDEQAPAPPAPYPFEVMCAAVSAWQQSPELHFDTQAAIQSYSKPLLLIDGRLRVLHTLQLRPECSLASFKLRNKELERVGIEWFINFVDVFCAISILNISGRLRSLV